MDDNQKPIDKPEIVGPMSHRRQSMRAKADEGPELPVEDPKPIKNDGRWPRFKAWYADNKKISIPLTGLALLIILFGLPPSRYAIAGLVIKKDISLEIKDSVTNTPVTGADVAVGNQNAITDANGKAALKNLKTGHYSVSVSKKYYKDQKIDVLVPVVKATKPKNVSLAATGRAVRIKVVDYVDGKPLGNVNITIADTNGKTDKKGSVTMVVPVGATTQKATLALDGYNTKEADIKISNNSVQQNDVKLAATGRVYFFSKRTGKLDLMKANLDGSDSQVVLTATGNEQVQTSDISQSPDWKYVALLLRRSSADQTPQLYILKTDDDKLINVDNGKANFKLDGWSGDKLIYQVDRTDLPSWQTGQTKLKSYDADSGKITLLDQQQGSDSTTAINEVYNNVVVSGNNVVYSKYWGGSNYAVAGKQNTVQMIDADGQNHRVVASYDAATTNLQVALHNPTSFYIATNVNNDYTNTNYFEFTTSSLNPKPVNIDTNDFYPSVFEYYQSPAGNKLLWSEPRDGKNTVLIGDQSGGNPVTIGSFSDYRPFGWFTDKYVILSKNSSELYIMAAKGSTPLKITDYQSTNYYY
jgi:hypothetical protein